MAYSYYVPLVVQSGQVTGTVTDFVALIDHTFAPWKSVANGGHVVNTSVVFPADWAIFADSALSVPLEFQIISWDATTGHVLGWVQTDVATSTTVYIGYGDASVVAYQGDAVDTWTGVGFAAVYQMDVLSGGSTWLDNLVVSNLTNTNGTLVTGKVDDGGDFNGTTAYARRTSAIVTAPPLTISCWINPDALNSVVLSAFVTAGVYNGFALIAGSGGDVTMLTVSNDFAASSSATKSGLSTGSWQHVAGVTSGVSSRYAYFNGVGGSQDTTSVTPTVTPDNFQASGASHAIGGNPVVDNFYNGLIDEVRVHNVARSAAWIEAEYHSQNDATAFWVLGSEVPVGGVTGPAYYGYVGYYS